MVMTLTDEIRQALASSSEPMRGRDVCDALGCETPEERNRVYSSLAAMVCHENSSVEKNELGEYMLRPGWSKRRHPKGPIGKVPMPKTPEPITDDLFAEEAEPVAAKATVDDDKPAAVLPNNLAVGMGPAATALARRRTDTPPAPAPDKVMIARHTIRTLLIAVLEHTDKLTVAQRQAVIDATREAA